MHFMGNNNHRKYSNLFILFNCKKLIELSKFKYLGY